MRLCDFFFLASVHKVERWQRRLAASERRFDAVGRASDLLAAYAQLRSRAVSFDPAGDDFFDTLASRLAEFRININPSSRVHEFTSSEETPNRSNLA